MSVSYHTIHQWCRKFGQTYATDLRRRRPRLGDKWHLDKVFIKIRGKTHYLWRAVDQHGIVLDILVISRRDAKAATKFFPEEHNRISDHRDLSDSDELIILTHPDS